MKGGAAFGLVLLDGIEHEPNAGLNHTTVISVPSTEKTAELRKAEGAPGVHGQQQFQC